MRPTPSIEPRSLILTPVIAFALCLVLTIGASFFAYESAKVENAARFDRAISTFNDTLKNRMMVYTNSILYTRNLLKMKPDLTASEFHQFVGDMKLHERMPGIQTLGYIERLPLAQAQEVSRSLGTPAALVPRKETSGAEASVVRFVELIHTGSESSLGLDLGVSPDRLAAMDQARDAGHEVATHFVYPMAVKPTAEYMDRAFLVFAPLYKGGLPLETVEQRRRALKGFAYAGFHAPNLFGRITDDAHFRHAGFIVEIFDGVTPRAQDLIFSEGPRNIVDPLMAREFVFQFADHAWTLRIVAPQSYSVPALRWLPGLVFSLGLLLSLFLALALRRSQDLALRLADDIRVRKETQQLLSEARTDAEEANRAKSIFLANISHEIRTPLGVMLGFSELALHQELPLEREESLKTVIRNGRELTRIIGDVLDVSKIEAQTLKIEELSFDLDAMINEVDKIWRPLVEAKGVKFQVEKEGPIPRAILSDETRIKQVLTNLLSNALKFTSKGLVCLSVRAERLLDNRVQISFTVSDSGIGISEAQRERLFRPFSQGDSSITRRYGGSGLGLALSRAIATTLGGDLILSDRKEGSRFTFTLPVKPVAQAETAVDRTNTASLRGRRILLVDDSPDNRALVSLMLKKADATVDVAIDGDDGVQKALNRQYDLILMDIQMPNKDGYTALRELRDEHHLRVPIIALTAHALREERERAMTAGFAGYITKPVDRETLVRLSAEMLAARP